MVFSKRKFLITLIVFMILLSFFTISSFAATDVSFERFNSYVLTQNGVIRYNQGTTQNLYRIKIEPGKVYTFSCNTADLNKFVSGYTDETPSPDVEVSVSDFTSSNFANFEDFSFSSDTEGYYYFFGSYADNLPDLIKVQVENGSPLTASINKVLGVLNENSLFAVVDTVVPFIAIVTFVGLGFFVVRRLVKKLAKSKGGV